MEEMIKQAKEKYIKEQKENKMKKFHKWYNRNIDRVKANSREYYHTNKDKYFERSQITYVCHRCGSILKLGSKSSHDRRTKCGKTSILEKAE